MQVEILYRPSYSVARLVLERNEKIQVESGAMLGMSPDMEIETEAKGGFLKSISRSMFGGESFFMNTYTGQQDGDRIILAPPLPGDVAVVELAFELPSYAEECAGRTPVEAHPELLEPRHPFCAEHELALFDLGRVDAFLSTFTWTRKVGKTGQICIGGQHEYYAVGRAYARQEVVVCFDPADRCFVFYLPDSAHDGLDQEDWQEIGRRPARNLEVEDLTGLAAWPDGLVPQQLPLPLCFEEG